VASVADLLTDAFNRVQEEVHAVCDGLTIEQVTARPGPDANTVGWLIWHLTRVQDDHVAAAAGLEQVWTSGEWSDYFGLPFEPDATGYGQSPEEVGAVVASPELLTGYYDAVHAQTLAYVKGLGDGDLDRVVDERWDPPVTLGVRLTSVISDDLQHIGQAAYVRGMIA
jgi:hypothetical protein